MFTYFIAGFTFLYGLTSLAVTSGLMETTAQTAYQDPIAGVLCTLAGLFLFPLGGDRMERQLG